MSYVMIQLRVTLVYPFVKIIQLRFVLFKYMFTLPQKTIKNNAMKIGE